MVKNFNHQKTIGVVGATPDAHEFIFKANKLGFITYLLCTEETIGKDFFGADKTFIGSVSDEKNIKGFLMKSDYLVFFDYSLTEKQLEDIQNSVVVPQGDELLIISQDRILQKVFKESLGIHISPYETIVKPEDIKKSIRSIGYPAVLKSNYLNYEDKSDSFYIYDEEDIEQAQKMVKFGTYVLESWITPKHQYSLSLVKNHVGQVLFFPVIQRKYRKDKLINIQLVAKLDKELKNEMKRVATVLAENIQFQGAITIDFIISPADTLYVGRLYPFPTERSRYSTEFLSLSVVEAHLRAITSLPLPEIEKEEHSILWVPFYFEDKEKISTLINIQPNWKFTFYPRTKKDSKKKEEIAGHIIIKTEFPDKTLKMLKEFQF